MTSEGAACAPEAPRPRVRVLEEKDEAPREEKPPELREGLRLAAGWDRWDPEARRPPGPEAGATSPCAGAGEAAGRAGE